MLMFYFRSVLIYTLIFLAIFYCKRDWISGLIEQIKRENNLVYVDEQKMWWSVAEFAVFMSFVPIVRLVLVIGFLNVRE